MIYSVFFYTYPKGTLLNHQLLKPSKIGELAVFNG